ncbi:MAG TPA: hypothetical protein VEI97_08730, partial [bacterium]|nr:hypothetical protein [bacterium]
RGYTMIFQGANDQRFNFGALAEGWPELRPGALSVYRCPGGSYLVDLAASDTAGNQHLVHGQAPGAVQPERRTEGEWTIDLQRPVEVSWDPTFNVPIHVRITPMGTSMILEGAYDAVEGRLPVRPPAVAPQAELEAFVRSATGGVPQRVETRRITALDPGGAPSTLLLPGVYAEWTQPGAGHRHASLWVRAPAGDWLTVSLVAEPGATQESWQFATAQLLSRAAVVQAPGLLPSASLPPR